MIKIVFLKHQIFIRKKLNEQIDIQKPIIYFSWNHCN